MVENVITSGYLFLINFAAFTVALFTTMAIVPVVIKRANRLDLADRPDQGRHHHLYAVPRLGGIAVFVGVIAGVAAALLLHNIPGFKQISTDNPQLLLGITISGTLIFVTGSVDDIRDLAPSTKLLLQAAAAITIMAFGFRIDSIAITAYGHGLHLGVFAYPVTLFWLIGITNAFNLIDGIDGLSSSMAIVTLAALISADIVIHGSRRLAISFAMLGATMAFLRFNSTPAKIFLGDCGSLLIGFFLAVRSVASSTTEAGNVLFLIPLFALAFPIVDTGMAIARRWLRGHPFSQGDGRHLHHQLLRTGLSTRSTVGLIALSSIILSGMGLVLAFTPPGVTMLLLYALIPLGLLAVVFGSRWLNYGEFIELFHSMYLVFSNARMVLQEKVNTRDLIAEVQMAESLTDMQRTFEGFIDATRLTRIELLSGDDAWSSPATDTAKDPEHQPLLRIDFPVRFQHADREYEVLLRVWAPRPGENEHPTATRLTTRLGLAVEEWCRSHVTCFVSEPAGGASTPECHVLANQPRVLPRG